MFKKISLYFLILSCCFVTLQGCGDSKDDELQSALDKNKELEAELLKLAREAEQRGEAKPPAVSVCDRTKEVQELILLKVKKTDCKAITDRDLLAIKTIKIEKWLSTLKATDFSGLNNLIVLDIRLSGEVISLPAGLFSSTPDLEILFLDSKGDSVNIPSGLLSGLSSLEIINFEFSRNTNIPEDFLSGLISLKELNLDLGTRQTLPSGLLSGLTSLEVCNLDWTWLDDISVDFFSGLVNLHKITLYSKNYPPGLFSNLPALKNLDIFHETSEEEEQRIKAEVGEGVRVH